MCSSTEDAQCRSGLGTVTRTEASLSQVSVLLALFFVLLLRLQVSVAKWLSSSEKETGRSFFFFSKAVRFPTFQKAGKPRCTSELAQDEVGIKSRTPLLWASPLAAEKQGNLCSFEGKLQCLLCFSELSFPLSGVSYAEDARGCHRKARSKI